MNFDHATPGILLLLALLLGPVLYFIRRARRGDELFVRRIGGVEAVDEVVGRSAELGRPMIFTTGLTGVGPVLYACLGVLHYVARKAAQFRTRLLLPQNDPEVMAFTEATARDAYREARRSADFDPQTLMYLSNQQFAFASGYVGVVQREQVASAFLFGQFAAESLILAEAGQQVGAVQVAASVAPEQVPFFIASCDYTLIGEELFAASAYLTREPVQLGSLYGQDRAKMLCFVMIVIGVSIATWNSVAGLFGAAQPVANVDSLFSLPWSRFLPFLAFGP